MIRSCFTLFIFLFFFHLTLPLTINPYEIRDLENDSATFASEVKAWKVTKKQSLFSSTQCNGVPILGGYGVSGNGAIFTRTYTGLSSHNVIQFSMLFWVIDIAKGADFFQIYFDNLLVGKWDAKESDPGDYGGGSNICGGNSIDYGSLIIQGSVPHTSDQLTLRIVSLASSLSSSSYDDTDSSDDDRVLSSSSGSNSFSIGFRDINLLMKTSTSIPSLSACKFVSFWDSTPSCLCPQGYYDPPGNSYCTKCNSACKNCEGTGSGDCTSCASGYIFDGTKCTNCDSSCATCTGSGENQCTSCGTGKYLYWKNTCKSTCASPLKISGSSCQLPCNLDQFYYQGNNTCQSTCPSGNFNQTTSGDVKTCAFKCPSGSFLTDDGTCVTTCSSPFIQVIQGVEKYCKAPCAANNFLYQNNTCSASCPSPFIQINIKSASGVVKNCNFPCSGSSFLNSQGACQSYCIFPNKQSIQGVERYCQRPCWGNNYYYTNGSCQSGCSYPFLASGDTCNFKCSSGEFLSDSGDCVSSCNSPYVQVIQGVEKYCKAPCAKGEFLYQNNTCLGSCDLPFTSSNNGGVDYCNFSCASSQFLNWDDECQETCEAPLVQKIQGVEKYCGKPCKDDEFLYQNETCLSVCESPFVGGDNGIYKSCDFPCADNKFLTWDNKCESKCETPFIQQIQGTERYCHSPCALSDYFYQNKTCMESCAPNFFEFDIRSIKYCVFSCIHAEDSLFWNNTCLPNCNAPLIQVGQGVEKYCQLPCGEGESRYENGTCSQICSTPYVQGNNGDFDTCVKPCSESEFLNWDMSCVADCPLTFQKNVDGVLTCEFHCSQELYHYWNDTCFETCENPLVQVSNQDYEYCRRPCQKDQYLYENGSCFNECHYQIITDPSNDVVHCTYPCLTGEYLYQNDTCKQSCHSPYKSMNTSDGLLLCDSPCSDDEFYRKESGVCVPHCSFPLNQRIEGVLKICENLPINATNPNTTDPTPSDSNTTVSLSERLEQFAESFTALASAASGASGFMRPNNPHSAFMVSAAKSTKHIKLLNLSIQTESERRRVLEEEGDDDSGSSGFSLTGMFTYKMPKSLKNQFESQPLPETFQGKVLHSSFLVNLWEALTTFVSLIVLGIFFIVCDFIAKKTQRPIFIAIMRRLRTLTEWNFLLSIFFNCYDDITLYTIIELKTLKLNSFPAVVSFIICLAVCGLALYVLYKVIRITRESLKLNSQVADANQTKYNAEDEFCKKYSNCQVMYVGYQNTSFWKQAFLLIYIFKIILSYIIIGCLYNYAVVQTSLLTTFSLLMIIYLVVQRPTHDKFHLLVLVIFEIIGLVSNICMLSLAALTSQGNHNVKIQDNLTRVILACNLANDLSASLVLWIYILMAIYTAVKKTKEPGVDPKTAWLNVLVSPYQLPGMELYEEEDTMDSESGDPEKGLKPRRRRRIRPSRRKVLSSSDGNKRKVQPIKSLVTNAKQESEINNMLFNDDTLVNTTKVSLEKRSSVPNVPNFIRLESCIVESTAEIETEPQEQDALQIVSPVGSDYDGLNSANSIAESLNSPSKRLLLKSQDCSLQRHRSLPKSRLSSTRSNMTPLDKYLPSVIIEESSPAFRQSEITENETPMCRRRALEESLKTAGSPGENPLLKKRGLNRPKSQFTDQMPEQIINLDQVEEDMKPQRKESLAYSDENNASLNTFSKMMRSWKQRNQEPERSTTASIGNDFGSVDEFKGSREGGSRNFVRSGKRAMSGIYQGRQNQHDFVKESERGLYTSRGYNVAASDIGSGDEMIVEEFNASVRGEKSLKGTFLRPKKDSR